MCIRIKVNETQSKTKDNVHEVKSNPVTSNVQLNPNAPIWEGNKDVNESKSKQQAQTVNSNEGVSATQLCDALLMAVNMPKPEIVKFDGDPINYWNFINSFEVNIANKAKDERTELMYLSQLCIGKAKEAIQCCVLLHPFDGYNRARQILAQQFGQPHVITHALIKKVVARQQLKPNDAKSISGLARDMRRCQITLQQMGYTADLNASDTLLKVQQLLPIHLQSKLADRAQNLIVAGMEPHFGHLTDFIEKAADVANTMYGKNIGRYDKDSPRPFQQKGQQRFAGRRGVTSLSTQANQGQDGQVRQWKCQCCEGTHKLTTCRQFAKKSHKEKIAIARKNRLCDNCLKPWHFAQACRNDPACKVDGCGKKHHTLLHFTPPINKEPSQNSSTGAGDQEPKTDKPSGTNFYPFTSHKVCLRVIPVKVYGNGKQIETWALLDDGSDVSLCDKSLAHDLGLAGREKNFTLSTISKENHEKKGKEVSFSITGHDETELIEMDAVWTVDKLPISTGSIPRPTDVNKWPHLQGITIPEVNGAQVKLLIGGDVPEAFWVLEERRGGRKEPYATRCPLGWTIMGPINAREGENGNSTFKTILVQNQDEILQQQVERFWKIESTGSLLETDVGESKEDKRARTQMETTVKKVDGHYQMGLPWRYEEPFLPDNRPLAEARLQHLKRRLIKDDGLKQKYAETIQGYLDKGYARELSRDEQPQTGKGWSLPHHPVFHPQKPDKVRVVFDCAANYRGVSLNSQLLRGPDFTNSLVGVLLRFRENNIALVADIEAMFHQVRVQPSDTDALRFLWWPEGDLQQEPNEYKMLVHLFGATSSPSCAGYALRKVAEDNLQDGNEEAIKTIIENFYVDDCLKSVDSKEEAIRLTSQLREILQEGGFRLTKWISNDPEVLRSIPESERAASVVDLELDDLPIERTLGVLWDVQNDNFHFRTTAKNKPMTRRGILSTVSSIYDPLGFVAPYILTAKFLMQDLCTQGLGWDEKVGEADVSRWAQWQKELPHLSNAKIKRCFKGATGNKELKHELHVFSDASQRGYAAVAYLRTTDEDGATHCSFVMGKTRLSPVKSMSIPRLELSAAVLVCTLNQTIQAELRLPISTTTYWTDSTSVLQYIRNESRRFHTFVANRVAKIQSVSEPSQWRYVPTQSNPADDGSRGLHADELTEDCWWFTGPDFLKEREEKWPSSPPILGEDTMKEELQQDPEVKRGHAHLTNTIDPLQRLIHRYSTWDRLKRAIAWILRYKRYLRARKTKNTVDNQSLTVQEIAEAEKEILS